MEDTVLEEFVEEVEEILQELEEGVLLLEDQPKKRSLIDQLFRNMHTIKGGAGMVMQKEMADYAHHFENLLDKARSGEIVCTPEMATLLLDSLDGYKSFLDTIRGSRELNQELIDETLSRINQFLPGSDYPLTSEDRSVPEKTNSSDKQEGIVPQTKEIDKEVEWDDEEEDEKGYLLHLKFDEDMLLSGADPVLLIKELKEIGNLNLIPHFSGLPSLKNIDHEKLYLSWSAKLVTSKPTEEIDNILVFYQNKKNDVRIEPVESPPPDPGARSADNEAHLKTSNQDQKELEVTNVDTNVNVKLSTEKDVKKEIAETKPNDKKIPDKKPPKEPEMQAVQSIRVAVEKLDRLQNMVGETVTNQSRLEQLSQEILKVDENLGEMLLQFVEDNEKSVRELQDQILQVRMIPVGSIFTPMKRTVRDFANSSNKKIKLEIEGGDTELDKTVTEQLHGPLVHLVRNSMDHGIEDPQTRENNGKDPNGTILLKASHQEGYVIVEIEDDGKGINSETVFDSAVKKGLVNPSDELSEQEIFQLLFVPGFTTTTEVTDVSGRGVGMDTVKRDIEALLGTIAISSEPNKGTNVKLKLPLTLAIIEGMMIEVGKQVFTLPLLSVQEALRPIPKQIKKVKDKGELVEIRGEYIPLLRLHERLNLTPRFEKPTEGIVLVVQHANRNQCLLVDEIVDQRPVVIKSMEENFVQVPGIAGATILGDGNISFILDVPSLIN